MRDDLRGYYERELIFLRQMGAEFAEKYPKIASRLQLEAERCEDPHVERIIEAFAFLAGRVRLKIDDEFPNITESFLNVLYPHYLAPIPSMAIVQFSAKAGTLTTGYTVSRGTVLYSQPIKETAVRFRTGYPITLWPIEVNSTTLQSMDPVDTRGKWREAVLKLKLTCLNDTALATLQDGDTQRPIKSLRFYLNGDPQLIYPLYQMLFNHTTRVELRPGAAGPSKRTQDLRGLKASPVIMTASALGQVGFEAEESMLDYSARSFEGYGLLSEYFSFPEKFLFFDVTGFDLAAQAGFGPRFEIHIYLKDVTPPPGTPGAETFQLGCAPVINLFKVAAEPIRLTGVQHEYHLIPDVRRQSALEVYSVDSVVADDPQHGRSREFQPFYSFRHAHEQESDRTFWYASRQPSLRPDDSGTEVYLTLVDLGFNPHLPATSVLMVNTTCTNRDLPELLPFGGKEGTLEVEGAAPVSRVGFLTKPTPTLRPPLRRGTQWRLISHLTLNHLSLVNSGSSSGVPDALQEILFLYDLTGSTAVRKQILGIRSVNSRRAVRQTGLRIGSGFVRGLETTIEFDEDQYVGSGLFLFATILERFLGLYASINSFNQLVVKTKQTEGVLKQWPPRAGQQIVL